MESISIGQISNLVSKFKDLQNSIRFYPPLGSNFYGDLQALEMIDMSTRKVHCSASSLIFANWPKKKKTDESRRQLSGTITNNGTRAGRACSEISNHAVDLLPLIVGVKVGILTAYHPVFVPLLRRIPDSYDVLVSS